MTSTASIVTPAPRAASSPARDGVLAVAPIALGYVPFALVVGATVAEEHAGLGGWAGSWLIYGGSAHLAALRVLHSSGALVAIVTGLLVNARMAVYSASLGRRWHAQPRWFRAVAAALVIDPTWALVMDRPIGSAAAERRFFLGVGLTLGAVWSAAIGVGASIGARLHVASLEVVAPLCLVMLIAPRLRQRADRAAVLAGVVVAIAAHGLPSGTAVGLAIVAGWVAGELAERCGA